MQPDIFGSFWVWAVGKRGSSRGIEKERTCTKSCGRILEFLYIFCSGFAQIWSVFRNFRHRYPKSTLYVAVPQFETRPLATVQMPNCSRASPHSTSAQACDEGQLMSLHLPDESVCLDIVLRLRNDQTFVVIRLVISLSAVIGKMVYFGFRPVSGCSHGGCGGRLATFPFLRTLLVNWASFVWRPNRGPLLFVHFTVVATAS